MRAAPVSQENSQETPFFLRDNFPAAVQNGIRIEQAESDVSGDIPHV
jgi:hypothetical protein